MYHAGVLPLGGRRSLEKSKTSVPFPTSAKFFGTAYVKQDFAKIACEQSGTNRNFQGEV